MGRGGGGEDRPCSRQINNALPTAAAPRQRTWFAIRLGCGAARNNKVDKDVEAYEDSDQDGAVVRAKLS